MRTLSSKRRSIEAIPDGDIDFSDIPEADDSFWRRAELQMPEPNSRTDVRRSPSRGAEMYAANPAVGSDRVALRAAAKPSQAKKR